MDLQEHRVTNFKTRQQWYCIDNFCYVRQRTRAGTVTLRCAERLCRATYLWSPLQRGSRGNHNHDPNNYLVERNQLYQRLRERVQTEATNLSLIYEELAPLYPLGAVHLPYENVVSTLRFWRREVRPVVPRTIQEYASTLRILPQYEGLMLGTVAAEGATAVVLGMPNYQHVLRASTIIMADGTFQTVPAGMVAAQLLTIHAVFEGHFFHPVVVIMQNRRRSLYEAVLRLVWQRVGGNANLQYAVADYEEGLQRALEDVLGVRVQGCFFHYSQALLRRATQDIGPVNRRNSPALRLVRLYIVLALLPPALVGAGLAEIQEIAREAALPYTVAFHEYFVTQWMTRVTPDCFSVYGSAHRTTNVCESFHEGLRRSLNANPNVWSFTDTIKNKFAVCSSRFTTQRDFAHRPLSRRNYVRGMFHQRDVATRQLQLVEGRITLRVFLTDLARVVNIEAEGANLEENAPEVAAEVEIGPEDDSDEELQEIPMAEMPPPLLVGGPLGEGLGEVAIADLPPPMIVVGPEGDRQREVPMADLPPQVLVGDPEREGQGEIAMVDLQAPILGGGPENVELRGIPIDPGAAEREAGAGVRVVCGVCWDAAPERYIVPCGHTMCSRCETTLREQQGLLLTCPFCRLRVEDTLRFYLNVL